MSQTLSPSICSLLWSGAGCARVECLARRRLSLSHARRRRHDRPSSRSGRRMFGRGTGRHIRRQINGVRLSRRGLSQDMGAAARCWRSREPPPCAPGDGRERLARAASRWAQPRAKPHDGTIVTDKVNEMWGTDMSADRHPRGRAGLCLRRRGTRQLGNRRHSRRAFSQSLRGAGAGAPGGASVLRSHRARRGAWIETASRSWLQLHVRRFPGRNRMSGHRSFARPSCANPRAMASPSASSEP